MTYSSLDIDFLDSEALTDDCIELSSAQLDRAAQQAQSISEPAQQWQTYLDALALIGFQQWLEEWAADLHIDSSPLQVTPSIGASCLQVERLKLCLIATSSVLSPTIDCPKAIIDLSPFIPDLYILIEVKEEQRQVQIYGYLRRDRLMQQSRVNHSPQAGAMRSRPAASQIRRQNESPSDRFDSAASTYAIPLDWFALDSTALLVELRCLEPLEAISAPHQLAINVRDWLSDRLDEVTERLNGVLLPPLIPAAALRSPVWGLRGTEIEIPPAARGVSFDLQLGSEVLRLYAFTWVQSPASESFTWVLMLVLSAQPQAQLPTGVRLKIRDATQLLSEQILSEETVNFSPDSLLYSRVGGDSTDQFWVTIDLPTGETLTLPPFTFNS